MDMAAWQSWEVRLGQATTLVKDVTWDDSIRYFKIICCHSDCCFLLARDISWLASTLLIFAKKPLEPYLKLKRGWSQPTCFSKVGQGPTAHSFGIMSSLDFKMPDWMFYLKSFVTLSWCKIKGLYSPFSDQHCYSPKWFVRSIIYAIPSIFLAWCNKSTLASWACSFILAHPNGTVFFLFCQLNDSPWTPLHIICPSYLCMGLYATAVTAPTYKSGQNGFVLCVKHI